VQDRQTRDDGSSRVPPHLRSRALRGVSKDDHRLMLQTDS
jgi:hypothetical protein